MKNILLCIVTIITLSFLTTNAQGRKVSQSYETYEYTAITCRSHSASITDFGGVGDGKTLNTKAFQSAVDHLSQYSSDGGAQLFVPAGKWLTGSFSLTSHFTLFLHKDATLLAAQDLEEYPVLKALPSYGRGRDAAGGRFASLVFGTNLSDVIITGNNGTIDGQGSFWWQKFHGGKLKYTRPYLIELMFSDTIQISNITLIDSPSWNIHPVYSSNILVKVVAPLQPPKKRRNQPGNPNPDAEVIALSPKTIMATNRFLCEVCNKGFQREQNLQLHRRGHNLPWKLKQKSKQEVIRRKVYLCPEPTCVHHDPSRALGDLTGIKKHYYRKHGEKKFKCEKCSKRYAVQSDWKAHSKTCGTKEYRCDCGTIFSRRDSYITHRAFCDALIQESTRNPTVSFTAMAAAAGGGGSRPGFYGSAASALSHNHFGNNSNTSFAPLAAGYNLNRSSTEKFEAFLPQSSNPNPGPTNFLMQCPSNQGFLSQNDQTLMNQHGLISLGDNINNNNNNNSLFNLGYFQDNTKNTDHTSVPSLFTNADNNDPSALLRGLTSSSSSSAVVNEFGDSDNGNFQGLMNSLAATTDHQGRSGSSLFDLHFGNNLSMGGSDRLTLDFLGVSGGNVSNVNGSGGRSGAPLDVDMKFPRPNNPFEKS